MGPRTRRCCGLGDYADRLRGDGLPGRVLARATAQVRSRAWEQVVARHGRLPAVKVSGKDLTRTQGIGDGGEDVPVVVVRLDATVIASASDKEGAEANYKGFGFHPVRREALSIRAEVRDHRH